MSGGWKRGKSHRVSLRLYSIEGIGLLRNTIGPKRVLNRQRAAGRLGISGA